MSKPKVSNVVHTFTVERLVTAIRETAADPHMLTDITDVAVMREPSTGRYVLLFNYAPEDADIQPMPTPKSTVQRAYSQGVTEGIENVYEVGTAEHAAFEEARMLTDVQESYGCASLVAS
jgi:hypothetical protein